MGGGGGEVGIHKMKTILVDDIGSGLKEEMLEMTRIGSLAGVGSILDCKEREDLPIVTIIVAQQLAVVESKGRPACQLSVCNCNDARLNTCRHVCECLVLAFSAHQLTGV